MTVVLHGTWVPAARHFFLWGEAALGRVGHGRRAKTPRHPWQCPADLLAERLALDSGWTEHTATVWLPTVGSVPLPSPEFATTGAIDVPAGQAQLAPWRLTGLALPIQTLLDSLIRFQPNPLTGADLRAWRTASLLAMELLAGQQVLPALRHDRAGSLLAAWLPRPAPEAAQKIKRLADALPPLCRAVVEQPNSAPGPRTLVDDFLAAAVDQAMRDLAYRPQLHPRTPAGAWLHALVRQGDATVKLTAEPRDELYRAWQTWAGQDRIAGDDAFRLTFRLEPPELVEGEWRLSYWLQATDDPSLLVPVARLWREQGTSFTYLERRFEQPQERLLMTLGFAARLSAPIKASLRQVAPEAAILNTDDAVVFLRETAPLLESSGFGVLLPAGWRAGRARLQARARVKSPRVEGTSRLSLDSLVDFEWEVTLDGQPLSRPEFEQLVALKQPLVQLRGQWVAFDSAMVEAAFKLLRRSGGTMTLQDVLRLGLLETAAADAESRLGGAPPEVDVAGLEAEGWVADLLERLANSDVPPEPPLPAGLNAQLRPYQQQGFGWLAFLRRFGLGACLADDMGLGKTIQAITLLLHAREIGQATAPALLVCPTSVVGNWQHELQRFAPGLRVLVHRGFERRRGAAFARALRQHDVVLTSYPLLARDRETLTAPAWSTVVLDEAQNIKNPSTRQAQAARALKAEHRVALTGTPVENRLSELWSIMAFLNPGYLGSEAAFRRDFARPIERMGDSNAAGRLRRLTGPFILRRLKTDPRIIADLPDKLEMKVYCPLTQEQATLYEAVVREALEQVVSAESAGESMQRRGLVLAMLARLKQVCNHPAHFLKDGSALAGRSGKLARLTEMLEEAAATGDRALVFTQFAEMGALLQAYLRETLWEEVLFLHGGTPATERDAMVRRFQAPQGPKVFVLSLKAGGTGLNLTAANHVFHFDRWWNPAVENQATDRAFRIGQTRNVQVHKFICQGTLEERIDEMIESKRTLAESVLGSGENWLTELSSRELRDLVALRHEYVVEAQT